MLLGQRQHGSALVKASGRSLAPVARDRVEGCRTRPSLPHGDHAEERARALCWLFGKVLASCVTLQKFPGAAVAGEGTRNGVAVAGT